MAATELAIGLFDDTEAALRAVRSARSGGAGPEDVSVVARSHAIESRLARASGGTPGAEMEDSRVGTALGEIGGYILAAIALVLPGIGPIVAAGPLAAELGESIGHATGGIARVLERCGLSADEAQAYAKRVERGEILIVVHAEERDVQRHLERLQAAGARETRRGNWSK